MNHPEYQKGRMVGHPHEDAFFQKFVNSPIKIRRLP
jgi:hypothetical protein